MNDFKNWRRRIASSVANSKTGAWYDASARPAGPIDARRRQLPRVNGPEKRVMTSPHYEC